MAARATVTSHCDPNHKWNQNRNILQELPYSSQAQLFSSILDMAMPEKD